MSRCKHTAGTVSNIHGAVNFTYDEGRITEGWLLTENGRPRIRFECFACGEVFTFGQNTQRQWQRRIIEAFLEHTGWCG